jgi:DNA-binding NarL/FixJ family response regulator
MTYRIAFADDQVLVLECVRRVLAREHDLEVVAEAHDGAMLLELLRNALVVPDLIITDISMPKVDGFEVIRQVKTLYPEVKVLILTMHEEEEYLAQAMSAGATGYLLKDDAGQELIPAIRLIRAGCTYISTYLRPQFNVMTRAAQTDTARPGDDKSQTGIENGTRQPVGDPGNAARPQKPPA